MEYELTNIRDIYEKVPADRWEDCLAELLRLFRLAKGTTEFTDSLLSDLTIDAKTARMPESLTWKDDGKKEITAGITLNEKPMFYAQVKLK